MSSLVFLSDGREESIDRVPHARRNNAVKSRIVEKEARQGGDFGGLSRVHKTRQVSDCVGMNNSSSANRRWILRRPDLRMIVNYMRFSSTISVAERRQVTPIPDVSALSEAPPHMEKSREKQSVGARVR